MPTVNKLLCASNLSCAYLVTKLVFPTFDSPSNNIFITIASYRLSGLTDILPIALIYNNTKYNVPKLLAN